MKEGDTIKTMIDLDKRQIEWFINSEFVAATAIPLGM